MISLRPSFIKPRPLKFLTSMGCVSPSCLSIILGICVWLLDHSLESVCAWRRSSSPGGSCRPWYKFSHLVVWLYEKGDAFSCDQNLKLFCTTTLTLLLFSIPPTFFRKHFIGSEFVLISRLFHMSEPDTDPAEPCLNTCLGRMLAGVNLCSACSSNGECWVCSVISSDFISWCACPLLPLATKLFLRIKQAFVKQTCFPYNTVVWH